jgi:hypothetical protein
LGAIMLEEIGEDGVLIRSVTSVQLEDLILNFRFPDPTGALPSAPDFPVSEPAFCSQCGAALKPGAAFCAGCGHPIASGDQP